MSSNEVILYQNGNWLLANFASLSHSRILVLYLEQAPEAPEL